MSNTMSGLIVVLVLALLVATVASVRAWSAPATVAAALDNGSRGPLDPNQAREISAQGG